MTDPILNAIDNAVRDYGMSTDAMRWTPEPPEERHPALAPLAPVRIEGIEIRMRTTDGEEHTITMAGAEDVTISREWERPQPWEISLLRPARPPRAQSWTFEVSYPRDLRHAVTISEDDLQVPDTP